MSKPGSFLVQLYTAIKMVVGNHSGTAEYSETPSMHPHTVRKVSWVVMPRWAKPRGILSQSVATIYCSSLKTNR